MDDTEYYRVLLTRHLCWLKKARPCPEEYPKNAQAFDRDIWEIRQVLRQRVILHEDVSSLFKRMEDFALALYAESP